MRDIRVGVAIVQSAAGDIEANLANVYRWADIARSQAVELLCFPELNLTGYDPAHIASTAAPIPNPIIHELELVARNNRMTLLAGLAEKQTDGKIFAAHAVISPAGFCGVYRKLHIPPPEQGFISPANEVPIFSAAGITFGIQLCYDVHFPELSTIMALKGAEVLFIPHASPRNSPVEKYQSWMRHLPARAYDNSLFVIACNQTGQNGRGLTFPGVSVALDPSGRELASRLSMEESLLTVDLKEKSLTAVRQHPMRFFLPQRRTDLFAL